MDSVKGLKYLTIGLLVLATNLSASTVVGSERSDLSILVSSCDKYSQFWLPFFKLLDQNWPELKTKHHNVPIYLLTNKKTFTYPRVEVINTPYDLSWSDNMMDALNNIQTKYVLLFLDDYWIKELVDDARLNEILKVMREQDVAYVQLFADANEQKLAKPVPTIDGVVYKTKFQKYRASLQLAIWETKALKQILRSGESAWDFELAASIRSSGYPKEFLTMQKNVPIIYWNASHQGHMNPQALIVAQKMLPNYINKFPILEGNDWDLKFKSIKNRADSFLSLVKRNLSDKVPESYRYTFDRLE